MITALVSGLVLLAPPLQAGKTVAPQTTGGRWLTASFAPETLAARVDTRLATLKKAMVRYYYTYDRDAVGHTFAWCDGTIVDPKRFWLQIPNFDPSKKREPMNYETWVADGKRFGAAIKHDPVPGPMSGRPGLPPKVMNVWFKDFSRVILAGVGQPAHPMTRFVADARKDGYKVTVETRSFLLKGRLYLYHRLVAAKGPARYEVVVDGRGELPVSVTNLVGKDSSRWSAVDWNTRPGKEFNPLNARFMKPGATRDIAPTPRRS